VVPADSIRVSRVRIYSGTEQGSRSSFAYGTLTLYGRIFLIRSATRAICNSPAALRRDQSSALQPRPRNARRLPRGSVWAMSPFARHYSGNRDFLSFPPGTQMYHFPGFPPRTLCVQVRVTRHDPCRVSPFGDPCINARLRLHTAYRSLPRPSSASGAKASTIRPYHLNGIGFALCSFQRPDAFALAGANKEWPINHSSLGSTGLEKALKTEQQLLD
jgi:hypothetical protein